MTDIEKIKERHMKRIFSVVRKENDIDVAALLVPSDEIEGAYYFPDVDYSDKSRAIWLPAQHCGRLQRELALGGVDRIRTDAPWREKILGALRFWITKDYTSNNWWYNQISTPKSLLSIALMLDDYLTAADRAGIERIVLRGSFKAHCILGLTSFDGLPANECNSVPDVWRAANLMWAAGTSVVHAVWTADEELMRISVALIEKELVFSEFGIKPDGAFVQHGMRWYSGGYGRAFVMEMTPLINLLGGTKFAIAKEKIEILLLHVLDGQRHMHRNGYFDFNAIGREYCRRGLTHFCSLVGGIKTLSETEGIERADELSAFYREISGGEDNFEATVFYPSIAVLTHKKNGVYIGVRGRTDGILGAEHCNQEGVLSYNMSYGTVTCFMESGREYLNVSPIWDFAKIPGTTARYETDEQLLAKEGWAHTTESECRVTSRTFGDAGVLYERAVHDGISLNASFFTFGSCMVALGSDINDERGEVLHTTVEQCIPADEYSIEKNLVKNGKVTYKNLASSSDFVSSHETRTGSWHRNCRPTKDEPTTGEMLTVTMPMKSGDFYAYAVYAGKEPSVRVIKNDKSCQAVIADGKLMAVFHEDCELLFDGGAVSGKAGEILSLDV